MKKNICVYSSSSSILADIYTKTAKDLGSLMGQKGMALIFGGGAIGLMGETARAIKQNNGKVIGVIPEALNLEGIAFANCDELIVTKTMRERKAIMDERSDAFIALPGGFGTLEELLEIITLKQLRYHRKSIVILNVNNFYDELIKQFNKIVKENFAKSETFDVFYVAKTPKEAIEHIENYVEKDIIPKWLTHVE